MTRLKARASIRLLWQTIKPRDPTICLLCLVFTLALFSCGKHDYNPTYTAFDRLSQQIAEKYHLRLLSFGCGSLIEGEKTRWDFSVMETRRVNLEQAKGLAGELLQTTLDAVLTDPLYIAYFKDRWERYPNQPSEIGSEYFGFKVSFWDENMDRPLAPYVAQIRAVDGRVEFYYADPKTQALQEPPIETISYDDLLKQETK